MKKKLLLLLLFWSIPIFADDTCLELCSSCMENSNQSSCAKVETLCKCSAIIDNLKQELLANPSATEDTANSLNQDSLEAVNTQPDSLENQENANTADTTTVADNTALDSSTQVQESVQTNLPIAENQAPVAETNNETEKKKDRIFYFGVSLAFEQFLEETVANYDVSESDNDYAHLGANFGFFLRWYFYSAGSFQLGLNAVYHHGHYDIEDYEFRLGSKRNYYSHDVSIDYHNIMAEIPLTFRFGIPFILSPYISLDIHVRKPIYAWIDYDAYISLHFEDYRYSTDDYYNFDDDGSCSGAFTEDDWEFLGYLGFGLELTRHLSVQWQMLLIDAVTYTTEILNYKLLNNTWRISLDIAI